MGLRDYILRGFIFNIRKAQNITWGANIWEEKMILRNPKFYKPILITPLFSFYQKLKEALSFYH